MLSSFRRIPVPRKQLLKQSVIMREALEKEGRACGYSAMYRQSNHAMSQALMARADLVIATVADRWLNRRTAQELQPMDLALAIQRY
jgi:hypothetical protein